MLSEIHSNFSKQSNNSIVNPEVYSDIIRAFFSLSGEMQLTVLQNFPRIEDAVVNFNRLSSLDREKIYKTENVELPLNEAFGELKIEEAVAEFFDIPANESRSRAHKINFWICGNFMSKPDLDKVYDVVIRESGLTNVKGGRIGKFGKNLWIVNTQLADHTEKKIQTVKTIGTLIGNMTIVTFRTKGVIDFTNAEEQLDCGIIKERKPKKTNPLSAIATCITPDQVISNLLQWKPELLLQNDLNKLLSRLNVLKNVTIVPKPAEYFFPEHLTKFLNDNKDRDMNQWRLDDPDTAQHYESITGIYYWFNQYCKKGEERKRALFMIGGRNIGKTYLAKSFVRDVSECIHIVASLDGKKMQEKPHANLLILDDITPKTFETAKETMKKLMTSEALVVETKWINENWNHGLPTIILTNCESVYQRCLTDDEYSASCVYVRLKRNICPDHIRPDKSKTHFGEHQGPFAPKMPTFAELKEKFGK